MPSSAASVSFPGRTSTIATVSGVRRKTGLDVQIRVTAVQHHEDCQVLRLRLKRYATTSVHTRLHRRQRGQRLITAAAHSRHAFEVAPFSSPPFFAKGRPEGLWISMTHHLYGSQRRVSWSTTMCQKRSTSSFMPLSLHGRNLFIEDIELLLHACDREEKIPEPQKERCTTSRCEHFLKRLQQNAWVDPSPLCAHYTFMSTAMATTPRGKECAWSSARSVCSP